MSTIDYTERKLQALAAQSNETAGDITLASGKRVSFIVHSA